MILQARDRRFLRELAKLRIVDRQQAQLIAGFRSKSRANVRLLLLVRAGLLKRLSIGTVAGGRKGLYCLTTAGAASAGVPSSNAPQRKSDSLLIIDPFIEHQLALNSVILQLQHSDLPAGVVFKQWLTFSRPISQRVPLIPDAYIELGTSDGPKCLFLEVDRGTESSRVWEKKTDAYLGFAVSGEFQNVFAQSQFRVLVIVPSERRLQSLRRVVLRKTEKVFWFRSFNSINSEGFWSPQWSRPPGDQRIPLL